MGHKPHFLPSADQNAALFEVGLKGFEAGWLHGEENHVGLDVGRINVQLSDLRKSLCEDAGVFVVLGEPVHVVGESMNACSSQNARLPHAAAKDLAPSPRLVDNVLGPAKNRAN